MASPQEQLRELGYHTGFLVKLCGKKFVAGKSIMGDNIETFATLYDAPHGRLPWGVDSNFLLRYLSFRGHYTAGTPVYPLDQNKSGYCCAIECTTPASLADFVSRNRATPNINIGYECIAGIPGTLDMASKVAFDLDAKNASKSGYSTVVDKFRAQGWFGADDTIIQEAPFLDHVLPRLVDMLNDIWALRGTPLEPALSLKDVHILGSCKPYVEEQRSSILASGRISFHVAVPRLHFRNQRDRTAFAAALGNMLPPDLVATVDTSVYSKNHNMRLPGHRKFNGTPLMPYSRGGMYGDVAEFNEPWDIPAEVLLNHMWSFVAPHSQPLFTDEVADRFARDAPKVLSRPSSGTRRTAPPPTPGAADPRIQAAVAVYARYCTVWKVPWNAADYDLSLLEGAEEDEYGDGSVDFSVYLQQRPGISRTCPVGASHTSNHAKLVVRRGAVSYFCLSAYRPCVRLEVASGRGEHDTLRNVFRKHCCEVYVGDLPFSLSEIIVDWVREPQPDDQGVLREPPLTEDVIERVKDIAASKSPGVDRGRLQTACLALASPYGSGKTTQMLVLIIDTLHKNPNARVAYVGNSQALVWEMAKVINAEVRKVFPDWQMSHYKDDNARNARSVALCSQSAAKFCDVKWTLAILDELEAQLVQVVGLGDDKAADDTVARATLESLKKLVSNSVICAAADANTGVDSLEFLREAGRIPVVLDSPKCNAFAGRKLKVHAVVAHDSLKVQRHCTYLAVVEAALAADGDVGIACTTVKAVQALTMMLCARKQDVISVHGASSETTKESFLADFGSRSVAGRSSRRFYVYSPTITGGISNKHCTLQLGILSQFGPSLLAFFQQLKRCRGAQLAEVWLLEDSLLRSRVPALVAVPAEPLKATKELVKTDLRKTELSATWDLQAVLRYTGASLRAWPADYHAEATDRIGDAVSQDTVYTKVDIHGNTNRMQLMPPRRVATLEDVVDDWCAVDIFAEGLAPNYEIASAASGSGLDVRATRVKEATLFDRIKWRVDLERRQRAANALAAIQADCKRLWMDFSLEVVVASPETLERARGEVRRTMVTKQAETALALCVFYAEHMRGRGPELYEAMVLLHAVEAEDLTDDDGKRPGESNIRAHAQERRARALRDLRELAPDSVEVYEEFLQPPPGEFAERSEDAGSDYIANEITAILSSFGDAGDGGDGGDAGDGGDEAPLVVEASTSALFFRRLYRVVLSWGSVNVDRELFNVYQTLTSELEDGLTDAASLRSAENALARFNRLFRRDRQETFRTFIRFLHDWNSGGEDRAIATVKDFCRTAAGNKRKRAEAEVLLCLADDLIRKAGLDEGLRARGDTRVLLYQNAEKANNRMRAGHRPRPHGGLSAKERGDSVERASKAVAQLLVKGGALSTRLRLVAPARTPMVRFMEALNKCLVPYTARWSPEDPVLAMKPGETKQEVDAGYKTLELPEFFLPPWVGEHTEKLFAEWKVFWNDIESAKLNISREERVDGLKAALQPLLACSPDGLRWLQSVAMNEIIDM